LIRSKVAIKFLEQQAHPLRSQFATLKDGRVSYVFTDQGIAMLSGILNSDRAINMNIAIMKENGTAGNG